MRTNQDSLLSQNFYKAKVQATDLIEIGSLKKANGRTLIVNNLNEEELRVEGKALATSIATLLPIYNSQKYVAHDHARRNPFIKLGDLVFTRLEHNVEDRAKKLNQQRTILATLSSIAILVQKIKAAIPPAEFNEEAFGLSISQVIDQYMDFVCTDGITTKTQMIAFTLQNFYAKGLAHVFAEAKRGILEDKLIPEFIYKKTGHLYTYDQNFSRVIERGHHGFGDGRREAINDAHNITYLKSLVASNLNIPNSGENDAEIRRLQNIGNQTSKRNIMLDYLNQRFQEEENITYIIDSIVGKAELPAMPEFAGGDQYNQAVEKLDEIKNNFSLPRSDLVYTLCNIDEVSFEISYKPNVSGILRALIIAAGHQNGYLHGDLAGFACPSMINLMITADKYNINLGQDFIKPQTIFNKITDQAEQLSNKQKFELYIQAHHLHKELKTLNISPEKLNQISHSLTQLETSMQVPGTDILMNKIDKISQFFLEHRPRTIARVLFKELEGAELNEILGGQEHIKQLINSELIKNTCDPEVLAHMEEVATIMQSKLKNYHNIFSLDMIYDCIDFLINIFNTLLSRGVDDEILQGALTTMKDASTQARDQGMIDIDPDAVPSRFVKALEDVRARARADVIAI